MKSLIFNKMKYNLSCVPDYYTPFINNSYKDMATVITLIKKIVRKDKAVVDIGFHLGECLLRALALGASHVYGIEASKTNCGILKNVLKENNINKSVSIINKAVYKSSGNEVEMTEPGDMYCPGVFTLCEINKHINVKDKEKIKTITMLDYLKSLPMQDINFIKIDIEGAEQWNLEWLDYLAVQKNLYIHLDLHEWAYKGYTAIKLLEKFQLFDCFIIRYGKLTPYNDFYRLPPTEAGNSPVKHIVLKTREYGEESNYG